MCPSIKDLGFTEFQTREIIPIDITEEIIETQQIIPPTGIDYNQLDIDTFYTNQNLQSSNFISGVSGWQLTGAGVLTATGVVLSGTITATTGDIGGWDIVTGYIYSLGSGTPTATPNDGLVLASGNEGIIVYENTEKRVEVGYLSAGVYGLKVYDDNGSDILFEVSDAQKVISGLAYTNLPVGTELAIQGWTHDLVFSITDTDTVAWTSGTVTFLNGVTYSIDAGNTGNMAAETYVYLDIGTSATVLQTSTTKTNAVGTGKIMICVAQNGTVEPTFVVFGSDNQNLNGTNIVAQSIVAANLAADTITANEIASNTITATEMNVSSLSAIAADLGTITAGNITLNSSGYIKGGMTDYNTGSGFWLGYDTSAYKFSIGNASDATKLLLWDGTDLIINGSTISNNDIYGDGSDGNVTLSSDTSLSADTYYDVLTIDDTIVPTTLTIMSSSTSDQDITTTFWGAQTFLSSAIAISIKEVTVYIQPDGRDWTAEIRTTSAGAPTGTILGSIFRGGVGGARANYTFTFATAVAIDPSTTYALVLKSSSNAVSAEWSYHGTGTYGDGVRYTSSDSGGTWDIGTNSDWRCTIEENLATQTTLNTNGYRCFAQSVVFSSGLASPVSHRIARAGNDGGDATDATGTPGAAATALADGSIKGADAGKIGGAGSAGSQNNGIAGADVAKSMGVVGVAGGDGGDSTGATAGGTGGAAGAQTGTVFNKVKNAITAYLQYDFLPTGDNLKTSSGSGSGGSGGSSTATDGGGGGGSATAGGICTVFAKVLTGTGTIETPGGDGGDGSDMAVAGGGVGGGGGGAGGSGGMSMLIYTKKDATVTVTAIAGSGGAGGNDGGGDAGSAGTNGNAGTTLILQV